jgi:hypothetical protein
MTMVIDPLTHPERLAALHAAGVLDAPPDAAFDRVAALAAALLRAPFATVSFLDIDRQFIAGSHGLPGTGRTHARLRCRTRSASTWCAVTGRSS